MQSISRLEEDRRMYRQRKSLCPWPGVFTRNTISENQMEGTSNLVVDTIFVRAIYRKLIGNRSGRHPPHGLK